MNYLNNDWLKLDRDNPPMDTIIGLWVWSNGTKSIISGSIEPSDILGTAGFIADLSLTSHSLPDYYLPLE